MKYSLPLVLSFCLLLGCKDEEKIQPPDELVAPRTMANILIDIHVQQSVIAIKNLPPDSARKLSAVVQKVILEKHGVADSIFRKNYNYYVQSGEMADIYEVVIDSLGVNESRSLHRTTSP